MIHDHPWSSMIIHGHPWASASICSMWSKRHRLLKGAREGDPVLVREAWWVLSFGRLSSQYPTDCLPCGSSSHSLIHWYMMTWCIVHKIIIYYNDRLLPFQIMKKHVGMHIQYHLEKGWRFLGKREALDAGASTETRCMVLHFVSRLMCQPKGTLEP